MSCGLQIGPFDCCSVVQGNCLELMKQIPDGCVDAVITDPPYGSGLSTDYAERFSPQPGSRRWWNTKDRKLSVHHAPLQGDDAPFDPSVVLAFTAKYKVMWGGNWYAARLPDSGGWFVWDKRNGRRDVSDADWPMSEAELAWSNIGKGVRVFRHTWFGLIRDSERGEHYHPTQKPVELMAWCIEQAKFPETILDPYCGSGSTLVAAKRLGRHYLGFEISDAYCEIARKRLDAIDRQPTLFSPKPEQMTIEDVNP